MSRNCCAHGCTSTTQTTPFRKFYTLTQVRASLTEWLLALNRLDILADFTIRKKADSFSICEMHFPSIQKDAANTIAPVKNNHHGNIRRFTNNKETQTDTISPALMITPVEIVDIQPEPMISQAINNMPRIDAFNIPATGQPSVNGAFNIPGFSGNITPIKTMAPVQVKTSRNLPPPRILRKIRPKINVPIPGYIINLNSLQPTPATMNIVNMAGTATATNYNQPGVGNVASSVPNTSVCPRMDDDEVKTVHDTLEVEDLIKIDSDDEEAEVVTDDYVSEYGGSKIDTEPGEFGSEFVRIQFPTSEDAQEEDDGHYVKFEVEESSDKMETYCFFDEDNEVTAKKRKVETMDGSFQIVKLEVEPDRTII